MNAKKNKHKNKQKPVNPVPAQQKETEVKVTEDVKNETTDLKPKSEELPKPESISSEFIDESLPPVSPVQKEGDTPKKPKRNRGKKRKEDEKEETSDVCAIPVEEPTVVDLEAKIGRSVKKENIEENVAPTARKKKNKNKKTGNESQEITVKEEIVTISDTKDEVMLLKDDKEVNITNIESENKPQKKKNKKKKNRTDSEKSDKPDESLLCTAAFQQFLEKKEIPSDSQSDVKTEDEKPLLIDDSSTSEATVKETSITKDIDQKVDQISDLNVNEEVTTKCGKNKKKNKSDKNIPKSDIDKKSEIHVTEENLSQKPAIEKLKVNVVEDILPEITKISEPESVSVQSLEEVKIEEKQPEKSLKPKAIIAKPVEKKIKEQDPITMTSEVKIVKLDIQITESPQVEAAKEYYPEKLFEPIEPIKEILEPKEDITIECPVPKGKKGKNKQKSQQCSKETSTDTQSTLPSSSGEKNKFQSKELLSTSCESKLKSSDALIPVLEKDIKEQSDITKEKNTATPILTQEKDSKIKGSDTFTMFPAFASTNVAHDPKISLSLSLPTKGIEAEDFETIKHGKKKKSPKPQKKNTDASSEKPKLESESVDITLTEIKEGEKSLMSLESIPDKEFQAKVPEKIISPFSENIPDLIEYPRSTSQEPFDGNNNKYIIQEVSTAEVKNVPMVFPVVQGSGETPTPDKDIPEKSKLKNISDNIDLKTKMLEVNKSMEDIRKSIERTIAGLAGIESIEKEEEKRFEEKQEQNMPFTKDVKDKSILQKPDECLKTAKQETCKIETIPEIVTRSTPEPPARKDNKGKGKSKKKGKQETEITQQATETVPSTSTDSKVTTETKQSDSNEKNQKTSQDKEKTEDTQKKGKQQSLTFKDNSNETSKPNDEATHNDFSIIDNFEDALTSSVEDVNKTFEMISSDTKSELEISQEIKNDDLELNIDKNHTEVKENPVSQPKNLIGHPDIPASSNKTDYKKEKDKIPNMRHAKVKIKDCETIETAKTKKQSKECQTVHKPKVLNGNTIKESSIKDGNEEYVYKYSFRKVFLPSACQVCKKDLKQVRITCTYCNLLFYCSPKHKDEDWPHHQALCFAVNTISHLKGMKHIYADAKNVSGQNYRLLRMQTILSCEKVLKRKLVPFEQEVLLYPRMCADASCREWRQNKLKDCEGCGQIFYCADSPDHLPSNHQRWCKSYNLYCKLVCFQQTNGRLEPRLPTKVMTQQYVIPEKMNEVLASMYEEKIDMSDLQYASLTQIATAPLTAAYCHQLGNSTLMNKKSFTLHIVSAELQFEADSLKKWETFFLHLRPDVEELTVVMVGQQLNPSHLPLDLLGKIKVCSECSARNRRVTFNFHDSTYQQYCISDDFIYPDIVCAFNASIQRSSIYNGKDSWPATITNVLKLKVPFLVTSYTLPELTRDITRIKEIADVNFNTIVDPKMNVFASVRPDRNFISDDEMPLLFKNYYYSVLCGV